MKNIVIHHSADFDGLFCREIARKFLPDAELIGWDFGDPPVGIDLTKVDQVYVMDLPVDRVFEIKFPIPESQQKMARAFWDALLPKLIWIDHHASSIATHPTDIPGYRIDGVAACRLAWQWFSLLGPKAYREQVKQTTGEILDGALPDKLAFVSRHVSEPLAVRLAGEYDIWCKDDPRAELFQHGLKTEPLDERWWGALLRCPDDSVSETGVNVLLKNGKILEYARGQEYADVIQQQGFDVQFEGLTFLACNSHELDIRSHLFAEGIKPHHDALLGFTFAGRDWRVSLYHIEGKEDRDILSIAQKYGGGGHRGACGFRCVHLPFKLNADKTA